MKILKYGEKAFAALLMMLPMSLMAQSDNIIDEVIWVVGDEAILKSDVEEMRYQPDMRLEGNPYCVIPERIAIQKLFLHQAKIDSVDVKVTDAGVNSQVDWQVNQWISEAGSKEKLEEYQKMTLTQIRERLFDNIKDMQVVNEMRKTLTDGVKVTPAEVRRYFKDIPQDSVPFVNTQVEVELISMRPHIPQDEINRVKDELRDYTERINSGNASFSTLAILYSEDPGSARSGGELDYAGKATLDPSFANVAFSLTDPKKISKIVESEYGFHIIQLVDKRGDKVKVRHILRRPRLAQADIDTAMIHLDSIAEDIRRNVHSFEDAASHYSDDKDSRNNHGLLTNVKNRGMNDEFRTSKFLMQELPQEVARAVDKMNVGEISAPFTMINSQGKETCCIVKLKNRIKGHYANIAEDFQILQDVVLNQKKEEKLKQWILDKQRTTYVRINEKYRDCEFQYPGWIK